MIGTDVFACPGVKAKGLAYGTFSAGLSDPPPAGTITPPPPKAVVPVAVEAERDLFYLSILMVVTLGNRSLLSLLIRLTCKDTHCRYLL